MWKSQKAPGVHAHYIKSGDHTVGFGAYANFTYNEVLRVDPDWCGKIVQYALVEPQADPKALPLALFVMHWSLHDVFALADGTCSAAAAPELLAMMPLRKAWHAALSRRGRQCRNQWCAAPRVSKKKKRHSDMHFQGTRTQARIETQIARM